MSSAPGKASYGYDGHGRRTLVSYTSGANRLQVYTQDGRLVLTQDSAQGRTEHLYLGSQLIGEVHSASGASYLHTDALGSPVATTQASGAILSRTRYEPYGGVAAGTNPKVHGYTGHAQDADTGLVYMQQRYYEPVIGRFLSVDPVVANTKDGGLFNRYNYASNSPYKYKDPTGRIAETVWDVASLVLSLGEFRSNPSFGNAVGVAVDAAAVLLPGVPGGVGMIRAGDKVADSVKATKTGKNDKHVSQDRKQQAREAYEKKRQEYLEAKSQPGKSKEDVAKVDDLKKQMEHLKRKADDTGENHSMKSKK